MMIKWQLLVTNLFVSILWSYLSPVLRFIKVLFAHNATSRCLYCLFDLQLLFQFFQSTHFQVPFFVLTSFQNSAKCIRSLFIIIFKSCYKLFLSESFFQSVSKSVFYYITQFSVVLTMECLPLADLLLQCFSCTCRQVRCRMFLFLTQVFDNLTIFQRLLQTLPHLSLLRKYVRVS